MNKTKEKNIAETSTLKVVGCVYHQKKEENSTRLEGFLQARKDFVDCNVDLDTEDEEAEKLKVENDHRVEELLAKASKEFNKQNSTPECKKKCDSAIKDQECNLKQECNPRCEENGNTDKGTKKQHSKADALEQLRRMEWKRNQEDYQAISRYKIKKSNGIGEKFPALTNNENNDEYFSGTRVKKNREKKKTREEIIISSVKQLEMLQSGTSVAKKNPELVNINPSLKTSCWQHRPGAALFEGAKETTEQEAEKLQLKWAVSESLKEHEKEEKRFFATLSGHPIETRTNSAVMNFAPPEPVESEEEWDINDVTNPEINNCSTIDITTKDSLRVEANGKLKNKHIEAKEIPGHCQEHFKISSNNKISKSLTTSNTNSKSQKSLYDNREMERFCSIQEYPNEPLVKTNTKSVQKELSSSFTGISQADRRHVKKEQFIYGRKISKSYSAQLQNEDKFFKHDDSYSSEIKSDSFSFKNKCITVQKQESFELKVKSSHCAPEQQNKSIYVKRNIHDLPSVSCENKRENYTSSGAFPVECIQHERPVSAPKDKQEFTEMLSKLHIESKQVRSSTPLLTVELTHQKSVAANAEQPSITLEKCPPSDHSYTMLQCTAKAQYGKTNAVVNFQDCRQTKLQQDTGVADWTGSSLGTQQYSHNVSDQSERSGSYIKPLEELQNIRMCQNLLIQLQAQEQLRATLQQQLHSLNALRIQGQQGNPAAMIQDLQTMLPQHTQNTASYSAMLQSQYPNTLTQVSKGMLQQEPSQVSSFDSQGQNSGVQKQIEGMMQQPPNVLFQSNLSNLNVKDQTFPQQHQLWNSFAQPGVQASTKGLLSLQTPYSTAAQFGYVEPTVHSHSVLPQQYLPRAYLTRPQNHMETVPNVNCGLPNLSPNSTMLEVDASQYNTAAQLNLMMSNLYGGQQPSNYAVGGLGPTVPKERPKSKGRGRLMH